MFKKIMAIVLVIVCMFAVAGCGGSKGVDDALANEPNFTGVVEEIADEYIMVNASAPDELAGSTYQVSTAVQMEDGMDEFSVGDTVTVYFDGKMTMSLPAQVNYVHAILLADDAE